MSTSSSPSSSSLPSSSYAQTALTLLSSDWNHLGLDFTLATSSNNNNPVDLESRLAHQLTALLVPRLAAVVAPLGTYPDLSATSICKHVLVLSSSQTTSASATATSSSTGWPSALTTNVLAELAELVRRMVRGYKAVEYHSAQHAFHVVLSASKLIELLVHGSDNTTTSPEDDTTTTAAGADIATTATSIRSSIHTQPSLSQRQRGGTNLPPSFGLRHDPLLLFALIFAALIHDVEHQGLPNRQLALEKDRLAVLYNDQSIAENWSLYVAFSEFLQDDFASLRQALFGGGDGNSNQNNTNTTTTTTTTAASVDAGEQYLRFRKAVVNLVLTTDIASPERTQINKSKWKEAFGEPFETIERKVRAELRRASLTGVHVMFGTQQQAAAAGPSQQRSPAQRRMTAESIMSELSGNLPLEENEEMGDDDSLSGTPENTQREDDDDVVAVPQDIPPANTQQDISNSNSSSAISPSALAKDKMGPYNSSTNTATPSAAMAAAVASDTIGLGSTHNRSVMERRLSSSSRHTASARYRYRLGILRTVDLSGETLETYSRAGSISNLSVHMVEALQNDRPSSQSGLFPVDVEADEPDELKATVVLETLMTAADVAHNMQSWTHLTIWSGRLYLELRKAYLSQRGMDAKPKWFENQIGFLESYMLPLARRLEDTGVFGEMGPRFALNVEANRDRWLTEGYDEAQKIFAIGAEKFPMK